MLEIGCGSGDLLSALRPSYGLGVDFCPSVIESAEEKYPELCFVCLDAHDIGELNQKFDYIILSDLINDVYDIEEIFRQISILCQPDTRVLINYHSHLWADILKFAQRLRLANRQLQQNWVTELDLENLLNLTGFQVVRNSTEIVLPAKVPIITDFINKTMPKIWPFKHLALTRFAVARYIDQHSRPAFNGVSIVVPARNEQGHIERLVQEVPALGDNTELIFVEGGSSDDTYVEIEKHLAARDDIQMSLYRQTGKGKADAVRLGFEKARYDILMILDADISVLPEDIKRFYRALVSGKGEFINGVRLVYPMQDQAMRFLNRLGNKFFSYGFQFTLGQPIKDTLCGTKVISRSNYKKISENRHYFGDFDPYGDFDLIFGAAKLNLKIIDIPIRYQARTYGATNINRWSGGILLLKMLIRGLAKLKFI